MARPRNPIALLLVLGAMALPGCFQQGEQETFSIGSVSFFLPPSSVVNVTSQDLTAYPPLKELLGKWEASEGRYDGFWVAYPYKDGAAIIQALRAQAPNGTWPYPDYVYISYKGKAFSVSASETSGVRD